MKNPKPACTVTSSEIEIPEILSIARIAEAWAKDKSKPNNAEKLSIDLLMEAARLNNIKEQAGAAFEIRYPRGIYKEIEYITVNGHKLRAGNIQHYMDVINWHIREKIFYSMANGLPYQSPNYKLILANLGFLGGEDVSYLNLSTDVINVQLAKIFPEYPYGALPDKEPELTNERRIRDWINKLPQEWRLRITGYIDNPYDDDSESITDTITIPLEAAIDLLRSKNHISGDVTPFELLHHIRCGAFPFDIRLQETGIEVKDLIKDFDRKYNAEKMAFMRQLANYLCISKKAFLRWIRKCYEEGCWLFDMRESFTEQDIPEFWGDPWKGQPESYNDDPRTDYKLQEAIRWWSDCDDVRQLEECFVKATSRLHSELDFQRLEGNTKEIREYNKQLKKIHGLFFNRFRDGARGKLEMYGLIGIKKEKPLDYKSIEGMMSNDIFPFKESYKIGSDEISGLRACRIIQKPVTAAVTGTVDLKGDGKTSKDAIRKAIVKELTPVLINEYKRQKEYGVIRKTFAERLLQIGIEKKKWKDGDYSAATIIKDLSDNWIAGIKPHLKNPRT